MVIANSSFPMVAANNTVKKTVPTLQPKVLPAPCISTTTNQGTLESSVTAQSVGLPNTCTNSSLFMPSSSVVRCVTPNACAPAGPYTLVVPPTNTTMTTQLASSGAAATQGGFYLLLPPQMINQYIPVVTDARGATPAVAHPLTGPAIAPAPQQNSSSPSSMSGGRSVVQLLPNPLMTQNVYTTPLAMATTASAQYQLAASTTANTIHKSVEIESPMKPCCGRHQVCDY